MADDGLPAEGENGGGFVGEGSRGGVADEVDAAVDRDQAAVGDTALDLTAGDTAGDQLPSGNSSVLKVGEGPNDCVSRSRSDIATHTVDNPGPLPRAPLALGL